MRLSTFSRLKKIMARTTSENDAEALGSIRAANRLLTDEGLDWQRVLDRSVNVIQEVEEAPEDVRPPPVNNRPKHVDDEPTETLLLLAEEAAERQGHGTQDFVASVREQWERKRWLSDAQRRALVEVKSR